MLAATGALAGFVIAQFLPRQYVSRAVVVFNEGVSSDRCIYAASTTLSSAALKPIVLQSEYYRQELDFTPEDDVIRNIQKNGLIRCGREGNRDGFRVEFADADRALSLEMTRVLIEETGRNANATMKVIDPIRSGTTGPAPGLCVIVGIASGAVLGLMIGGLASPPQTS
jgi:hypothetical protein